MNWSGISTANICYIIANGLALCYMVSHLIIPEISEVGIAIKIFILQMGKLKLGEVK